MKTITAKIIADSRNEEGDRITTFLLCYPRFIHSELMTHRAFSRNAASSRAIPIEKMIASVRENPAAPIRWGKNGKGMQDHGEFTGEEAEACRQWWREGAELVAAHAERGEKLGLHKQIVNRWLETPSWMETLVTATDYHNFFALRVHKDAQPEFQRVAYLMLKAYLDHPPQLLQTGEWHLPFSDFMPEGMDKNQRLKISSARSARLSYKTFDGEMSPEKDFGIYDRLVGNTPGHWSPIEHPATPCKGRHGPYRGWKSYRAFHPNENITELDLTQHLRDYEKSLGVGADKVV
jgi:hypothetical protein